MVLKAVTEPNGAGSALSTCRGMAAVMECEVQPSGLMLQTQLEQVVLRAIAMEWLLPQIGGLCPLGIIVYAIMTSCSGADIALSFCHGMAALLEWWTESTADCQIESQASKKNNSSKA